MPANVIDDQLVFARIHRGIIESAVITPTVERQSAPANGKVRTSAASLAGRVLQQTVSPEFVRAHDIRQPVAMNRPIALESIRSVVGTF
jgi:hypothetical protein